MITRGSPWIGNRWLCYGAASVLVVCVSCQTTPHLILEAVGPPTSETAPGKLDFIGTGFLRVHSATDVRYLGKTTKYYPHTSYLIYSTNGHKLKWVRNATGDTDEAPMIVRLPAGLYSIRAQDDAYGRVSVPVQIQNGRTTAVYLETWGRPPGEQPEPSRAVRLPDGRVVGWRAMAVAQ